MTGYGYGTVQNADYHITAELKSVNHRYCEINFKLPQNYLEQEVLLKNYLQKKLKRGKIFVLLSVEHLNPNASAGGRATIDAGVLASYYEELHAISTKIGIKPKIKLTDLLELPNVLVDSTRSTPEEEWNLVQQAVEAAVQKLIEVRNAEGEKLQPEFEKATNRVTELLQEITPYEEERVEMLKQKMETGLKELANNVNYSEDRYQQELFYYLEKMDIAEEKARIKVHLDTFRQTMEAPESNGRKLLFLTQELWREVNTLGNKSYHIQMQERVVQMKEELEKMKEQLMNIV